MAHASPLDLAIADNRRWYDAMFDALGLASACDGRLWQSNQPPPAFHSNLLVLAADVTLDEVATVARRLDAVPNIGAWSLKDAHARLDLRPLGLVPLFDAQWIWRPADRPAAAPDDPAWSWYRATSLATQQAWAAAWLGDGRNEGDRPSGTPFPPRLTASADHAFLAGARDGAPRVGAIAQRQAGAVGLSNLFAAANDATLAWHGLVALASASFPGLPLVGYERGDDLAQALAVGFEPVGSLRVWQRRQGEG